MREALAARLSEARALAARLGHGDCARRDERTAGPAPTDTGDPEEDLRRFMVVELPRLERGGPDARGALAAEILSRLEGPAHEDFRALDAWHWAYETNEMSWIPTDVVRGRCVATYAALLAAWVDALDEREPG